MGVLLIWMFSGLLYFEGSGVMRVDVVEMMDDQMVLAYSMMGRSNVLYVVMCVSLLFPQCLDVRSFRRLSVFFCFSDDVVCVGGVF